MPLAIDVTSGDFIFSVLALVLAIIGTPLIIWKMNGGFDERGSEDAARDYFEEHGRWPDQTEDEAAAERAAARSAAQAAATPARPDADGRV